ncbi:hypothetical protein [Pseudoclavibacter soli]|uniref:hypothetical protein n=1 Tax=Pseudoclavibacter soli TaxID=452623 RepID=UPI0012EB8BCB|nr:hypothetical protein [Pseudoclavibacter soli]
MESFDGFTAMEDPSEIRGSNEQWLQRFDGKDYCPGCTVFDPSVVDADEQAWEDGQVEYPRNGLRPRSFWNTDLQLRQMVLDCSPAQNHYVRRRVDLLLSHLNRRTEQVAFRLIREAERLAEGSAAG